MSSRLPVTTALIGFLVAPSAMAQQPPVQNAPPLDPTPTPPANPADPSGAPATMQPVTVTGTRPSEDFLNTRTSINRLGADNVMDIPQTVVIINRAP